MEQRLQLLEKTAELAGGGHAAMTAALPLVHGAALRRAVSEQQQVYSLLLAEASRLLAAAGQRPPAANRSRLGSFFVLMRQLFVLSCIQYKCCRNREEQNGTIQII